MYLDIYNIFVTLEGLYPKTKKISKDPHTDDDHGTHSVDTDFTYVIVKTP